MKETREVKRQKLIKRLEEELRNLRFKTEHPKISNLKIYFIRFSKISFKTLKLITPFILVAGLSFVGFAHFNETPVIKNDRKKKLETKTELDSYGNIRYEKQYGEFKDAIKSIEHYDEWHLNEEGLYERTIKSYATGKIDNDLIIECITNNDINSLEEAFGNPISVKTESKNLLTEEELNTKPFMKATFFSTDENNYIMVEETDNENFKSTLIWFLVTLLLELITITIVSDVANTNLSEYIREIKEKYPLINIEELVKKLEIKEQNYNRLMR